MNWPWKHKLRAGVAEAREIRQESERLLAEAERTVTRPLREMRERNHVRAEVAALLRGHRTRGEGT